MFLHTVANGLDTSPSNIGVNQSITSTIRPIGFIKTLRCPLTLVGRQWQIDRHHGASNGTTNCGIGRQTTWKYHIKNLVRTNQSSSVRGVLRSLHIGVGTIGDFASNCQHLGSVGSNINWDWFINRRSHDGQRTTQCIDILAGLLYRVFPWDTAHFRSNRV